MAFTFEALHKVPQIPRDKRVPKQIPSLGQPQGSEPLAYERPCQVRTPNYSLGCSALRRKHHKLTQSQY